VDCGWRDGNGGHRRRGVKLAGAIHPEYGPALQDGGAALMIRPSRTTSIIVAGLLVVGCGASHSPRSASQVASHPPAAAEASGSAPSVSQVASHPPAAASSAPSASQLASHPPAASEASTSSPSASPFPAEGEDTSTLVAGRYVTSDPFPIPVSVTVPAGWVSEEPAEYAVFLSTADGSANDGPAVIALVNSAAVFTDPCQDGVDTTPASPNDFVAAVAALRGVTVTAPKDVTVGGLPDAPAGTRVRAESWRHHVVDRDRRQRPPARNRGEDDASGNGTRPIPALRGPGVDEHRRI
jgi:hypothetical protein